MAIAATVEWEVRTTATAGNVNGGGYKPGASGTDFSQQDAAQYNLTAVTTAGADAVLLHASAAADMVGNIAHITSGTNFTVGWYEITAVTVGVSITLDRACATAAGAAGVVNIGGAMSLVSTLDDDFFEALEPGNKVHVKLGTYAIGETLAVAKSGTSALPIQIIGYNAARNDTSTGANRPTFAMAALTCDFGGVYDIKNIIFTTTESGGIRFFAGSIVRNCKGTNSSATVDRYALRCAQSNVRMLNNECISNVGYALGGSASSRLIGNYCHDSAYGIHMASQASCEVAFNIIDTCTTGLYAGGFADQLVLLNNTFYSGTTGINLPATTSSNCTIMNNIISGFTTGITAAAAIGSNVYDFNNFFNNTTNRNANVPVGANDIALDPGFVDAPNGDFRVGANMKAVAFPGAFPGGLSTSYLDIGAVQRIEPASVGGPVSQHHVKFQPNY